MLTQAHVYIKGDVIGVGFRAWTKIQCKLVGAKGWIRNNFERHDVFGPGGGVEVCFQGTEKQVEQMVDLVKKGPMISRVEGTEIFWQRPKEMFETFEIRK